MSSAPIYEERLRANTLLIVGISLWSLAIGLVPGIISGELWWLFALYIALTFGIIFAFFQMRVVLYKDRLVIRFGYIYRKTIAIDKIQDCAPHRIEHPIKTYGGWGIRKGGDGSFALTQAFINEAIKVETIDQTLVISTRKAEDLCLAIRKARGVKPPAKEPPRRTESQNRGVLRGESHINTLTRQGSKIHANQT